MINILIKKQVLLIVFSFFILFLLIYSFCIIMLNINVSHPATHGLHIVGNHFIDENRNIIILRGVNRWSLEFSCGDGHFTPNDFRAIRSWGANAVRIPLNENRFLFHYDCSNYVDIVKQAVKNAENAGLYVILDLQWVEPYNNNQPGMIYPMPDSKARDFWKELASTYANDDLVLFEVYNEPHDVSWKIWRNGGQVSNYQAVGMQELTTLINSIAPNRVVIIGGLGWSYDLSRIQQGYAISGRNIAFTTHLYNNANEQPTDWQRAFGVIAKTAPVIATEFGQSDFGFTYNGQVMNYFEHLKTGYLAWAWVANNDNNPTLLKSWNGTPSDYAKPIHDLMLVAANADAVLRMLH